MTSREFMEEKYRQNFPNATDETVEKYLNSIYSWLSFAEEYAKASGRPASPDVTEMYLCEAQRLILHPDQYYVFRLHPTCAYCQSYTHPGKKGRKKDE